MKRKILVLFTLVLTLTLLVTSCSIANKKVDSLQILSGAPTEVEIDQTPDFSAIKVKATYNDGEVKELGLQDVTISAIDTSKIGKVEYTVSYGGATAKATINVVSADGPGISTVTLSSITYLSGITTEFYEGADFHLTDLNVTAHYSDGTTKTIASDKLTVVQNIDRDKSGEQTLIVSYEGKQLEIKINVLKILPQRLAFNLGSFDTTVLIGEAFDTSVITATLYYNNSATEEITNDKIAFSAVDTALAGQKKLVGTYQGMSAECTVEVLGIKSIEFSGFKTSIKYNEKLDLSALKATVIASDNNDYEISADKITVDYSKFNTTLTNTASKTTQIAFEYCGVRKEYNVTVTADREDAKLTSLVYASGVKTKIFVGEAFDDSAITATANREFGYNGTVTKANLTVSGEVNASVAGTYPVTYSLTENGVTKSFTVEIAVVEPGPSDLVLENEDIGWVLKGEAIDTSNITAILYYEYGTKTTAIPNSELTFTGIDTSKAGNIEITVYHAASDLTEKITVTVVEIQSVTFNGVNERYRVNTEISRDEITVSIVGTDGMTYVRKADSSAVFPTLKLDTDKKAQEAEYVFTYQGFEYKQTIEVYAEFEDASLVGIEYSGATRIFKGDDVLSKVSVTALYTYGYTKEYRAADGVTITGDITSGVTGAYTVTVGYGDKTVEVTIDVVFPKVTGIIINSAPYGIVGEEYDFSSINVTVTFENNVTQTATLDAFVDYNITTSLDAATAGKKTLTLTANGNDFTYEVTVYEIDRIVIDSNNFDTVVQLGTEFSTEGLGKILVYLKGVAAPAIRYVDEFTHDVNVDVMGRDYTVTTTYLGVTSEPLKITVADQNFIITGVEDPKGIVAWKNGTYSKKFLDSGYRYFVGDDNPFKYELQFQLFDVINNVPGSGKNLKYESISSVTLDGVAVGAEYVTIDETNHTFDFTDAAIGKVFVITTGHKDYADIKGYSRSLEVLVVDGYNIYSAIELNLLTNENSAIGSSGKYQLDILYPFLASNRVAGINDMSRDQYAAFVSSINGIILHDNLTINESDLPDDYFFITSDGTKYLWDHQSVYNHAFVEAKLDDPKTTNVTPSVFNMYGNYFTVISNNVPIVATKGMTNNKGVASNDEDGLSSSELFFFDISNNVEDMAKAENRFYAENYIVNVYALGLHDNDPSVPVQDELAQKRSKLGVIGIKMRHGIYNLNSLNMEAYFISTFPDNDDLIVNYNYCTMYNAWSNHIMTWALNSLDQNSEDKYDGAIHAGYQPITLNINNSFMGKCGGPVIITVNKSPAEDHNKLAGSKNVVNVDENSNLFSYVKGDESWFVAYGATKIAGDMMNLNLLFQGNQASFVTEVNKNGFINMIILNMDSDFNPVTGAGVTSDIDGSLSIGGNKILDMDDVGDYKYGHNTIVDSILAMAKLLGYPEMPPIFISSMGGAAYTDTKELFIVDLSEMVVKTLFCRIDYTEKCRANKRSYSKRLSCELVKCLAVAMEGNYY